ncbi:MAG TPA: DNA polymerase [Gemmata sp.]|jgi:DNA polymerase-4|nr:DNA polymerase [Gemmata sp.]
MPLRYLFIDMNAFFASVEQQYDPSLRHKPLAVIPTDADTTCCIAASYEAKALGIRTGTPVWEARKLSRGRVIFKIANHQRYVLMHNRIVDAVRSIVPVDRIMSIDEMTCRLVGYEQRPERAVEVATRIKAAIKERAGDYLTCSIGIGPNGMLAKVTSDMKKPDGLIVLADENMPDDLYRLKLQDFPGIGPRMKRRLNLHGVFAVRQLCEMSARSLSEVWGSKILGERWFYLLRGEDVVEAATHRQSISHSHILPPYLRSEEGAYGVLVRLTHKAAARLRKINYWAGSVSVSVSFQEPSSPHLPDATTRTDDPTAIRALLPDAHYPNWESVEPDDAQPAPKPRGWRSQRHWDAGCHLPLCRDTPNILRAVARLWQGHPPGIPFKVGMVLADLRPARSATPSLFEEDRRADDLSHAMDEVNREFGASVIHFGTMHGLKDAAPTRVAFTQIPDFDRRVN